MPLHPEAAAVLLVLSCCFCCLSLLQPVAASSHPSSPRHPPPPRHDHVTTTPARVLPDLMSGGHHGPSSPSSHHSHSQGSSSVSSSVSWSSSFLDLASLQGMHFLPASCTLSVMLLSSSSCHSHVHRHRHMCCRHVCTRGWCHPTDDVCSRVASTAAAYTQYMHYLFCCTNNQTTHSLVVSFNSCFPFQFIAFLFSISRTNNNQ